MHGVTQRRGCAAQHARLPHLKMGECLWPARARLGVKQANEWCVNGACVVLCGVAAQWGWVLRVCVCFLESGRPSTHSDAAGGERRHDHCIATGHHCVCVRGTSRRPRSCWGSQNKGRPLSLPAARAHIFKRSHLTRVRDSQSRKEQVFKNASRGCRRRRRRVSVSSPPRLVVA